MTKLVYGEDSFSDKCHFGVSSYGDNRKSRTFLVCSYKDNIRKW